ncbi:hypothetical protein L107_08858 [Cyanobium sp. Copco_Reservoir_LC18]|uniref:hypothetical protein n=1 Tax=Cyanobium sp. Copco_Reservoir_LC18 TaxID=1328305 RepID=UPI001357A4E5|nr:hypothetical protein [Cyanobium sp. Copco_Reservoir_LC18]KAF0653688.1 hypothetical protein L107_08858 [Cyanobium sp. Copco_Reservoir_LC18]
MSRSSYPLITPPKGNHASIDWVMENPTIATAVNLEPDLGAQFLGAFCTSALLGGIAELFEQGGLMSFDLSSLVGASGGQLAEALNIANGWDPSRTFASSSRLFTPENPITAQGRTVPNFSQALAETITQLLGPTTRVYREVMFHGTRAHSDWVSRGSHPNYASGFDIVVVAGSARQILAIEIDEPCNIYNTESYHSSPAQKRKDDAKDADVARLGIPVLRLSEAQVWRHTPACLGLALRLLDLFTPIDFPEIVYRRLDYRAVPRQARFQASNVHDTRAPRGWRPSLAYC